MLVLQKPVFAGFSLAYVAHGPSRALIADCMASGKYSHESAVLEAISQAVRSQLAKKLLAIRYEPLWCPSDAPAAPCVQEMDGVAHYPQAQDFERWRRSLFGGRLHKTPQDIQPPDTVLVDIAGDEADILSRMRSKTRYNIKLAAKKGVQVQSAGLDELAAWYDMYKETAERDSISIHSLRYYQHLLAENPALCELLLARHEGDLIAGILVSYHGSTATYIYGASSNAKRNLMPAYALQWEAIKRARAHGCIAYDLFGLPPSADPSHPMHGLYQFKTGFGGEEVHRPGAWDYPVSPLLWKLFTALENLRLWYYRSAKKQVEKQGAAKTAGKVPSSAKAAEPANAEAEQ